MKKNIVPFAAALLLFNVAPFFAAAQTREERIETGRFGAEEPAVEAADPERGKTYKDYRFFLGLRTGPSLRAYTPSGDTPFTGGDTYSGSLSAGLQASLQIVPAFSLQAEAVFTWDRASKWYYTVKPGKADVDRYTRSFRGASLQFPFMAKLNFYPGRFRISPFFGAYILLPLGDLKTGSPMDEEKTFSYSFSPPLGLLGGLSAGLPLGPGMIFADIRYAADLAEPALKDGGEIDTYRRHNMTLSFGYEFGFFRKR
jgi:hypothetical protein